MNKKRVTLLAFAVLIAAISCFFIFNTNRNEGVYDTEILERILITGASRVIIEKELGEGLFVNERNGEITFMYSKDWNSPPAQNRSITIVWKNGQLESWAPVLVTTLPP